MSHQRKPTISKDMNKTPQIECHSLAICATAVDAASAQSTARVAIGQRTARHILHYLVAGAILSILCYPLLASASSKTPAKVLSGWIEYVSVENHIVKAKLDTGAKTSSMDAFDVRPYKKNKERRVAFMLRLHTANNKIKEIKMDLARARRVKIKNHDGGHDRRVVVELPICFNGRQYLTEFTLSDRKEYIYGVLLGREFLSDVAIIDPELTFQTLKTKSCAP